MASIITSGSRAATGKRWLNGAAGYEIYVRSFADSNDDGVGDIAGVTERLDYLAWLGIDIVWVTPFYPSPGFDHGYDVSNYCDVDPLLGTLDDVDALIERTHQLGMRVIADIVPNHTSSHHRWFQEALADPQSPERDYYLFRDPGPDGGPPNNWASHFGPTAWTLEPESGQYYCHLFLPEQPDLNWRNPAVRAEFDAIFLAPVVVDTDSLALDAIAEVGPGGHFFGGEHTQARYQTEFYSPMVSDWRNWESWTEAGAPDAAERAEAVVAAMLNEYAEPEMDPAIRAELRDFVDRRTAEGGVATDF